MSLLIDDFKETDVDDFKEPDMNKVSLFITKHYSTFSLVPRPHPQREREGLVYNIRILGCAESACSENG